MSGYRDNLIKAYFESDNKAFFDSIVQAEIFNDLLSSINKNREKILGIALSTFNQIPQQNIDQKVS